MEAKTALVRAKRRVELHTISTIDLDLALVVLPDDSKLDDPLGNSSYLKRFLVLWILLEKGGVFEGRCKLYGQYRCQLLSFANSPM